MDLGPPSKRRRVSPLGSDAALGTARSGNATARRAARGPDSSASDLVASVANGSRPSSAQSERADESAIIQAQLERESERDDRPVASNGARPSPTSSEAAELVATLRRTRNEAQEGIAGPLLDSRRPTVRPLPKPGPEHDEDVLGTLFARRPRRSMPKGIFAAEVLDDAEPELPPTPEHIDPVMSQPPSGIHITPSKRPRRSKALAQQLLSSSPLKRVYSHAKSSHADPLVAPLPIVLSSVPVDKADEVDKVLDTRTITADTTRDVIEPDPQAAKKTRRDELRAQVARLERDLGILRNADEQAGQGSVDLKSRDNLLQLLIEHLVPPEQKSPDINTEAFWRDAALNPASFLPFGGQGAGSRILQKRQPADEPPPISHHPVDMTAAEERPFLQVFSPFTCTSTSRFLDHDSTGRPKSQERHISIRTTQTDIALTVQISLIVDLQTLAIASLKVLRLDPICKPELAPFIASLVDPVKSHSGTVNNVSILTWAMSDWYRVATLRAEFWHALHKYTSSKTLLLENVQRLRGSRTSVHDDDHSAGMNDDDELALDRKDNDLGKGRLVRWMGCTQTIVSIPSRSDLAGESPRLRIEWKITFDWTGEAQSKIGVKICVPAKWHKADERGSIAKVPQIFDEILHRNKDPLAAVQTVIALLAGGTSP